MLDIKNLCFFRGMQRILRNISFTLNKGEALLIKGANGSGKTTLLKLIAGLLEHEDGTIHWQGHRVKEHNVHYFGHSLPVDIELTGYEMLHFWLKISNHRFKKKQIEEHLSAFKINANDFIRTYSQGQKKRLFLAYYLNSSHRPIWIMDEIFTNLDQEASDILKNAIMKHLEAGGVALLSTHEMIGLEGCRELVL
ncbi:MAG: heme ABC exporter ATP-binding protein CcmA [Alphaproteobacteria bacterium]|nr:heme ABC exporter ATP-binding protein CcmA [Alphaproteobacteria bacterium]